MGRLIQHFSIFVKGNRGTRDVSTLATPRATPDHDTQPPDEPGNTPPNTLRYNRSDTDTPLSSWLRLTESPECKSRWTLMRLLCNPKLTRRCLLCACSPRQGRHRQPTGETDGAPLEQSHHHPQAGRQMSSMSPGDRLTQPTVQGIIERGAFIHGVLAFEWYLSLERWLPYEQVHR